jgi:hypothetical protein
MSSQIRVKRSSVAGKKPNTSNLSTGELALNLSDSRLYSSNGTSIFEIGSNPDSITVGAGGLTIANSGLIDFTNSNIVKFNQVYTGRSSGSYFTNGEYQKVVTITPDGNSQNYQVVGRITAQNAGETHTVYFNAALRSNTLPALNFTVTYDEEYNGARYLDPQLWTKTTSPASFVFAFKTLATIYGTVTVDIDVIPRSSSQKDNITFNRVQDSEVSSVDSGFTENDMTRVISKIGNAINFSGYTFPNSDGTDGQALLTDGNGTLTFQDVAVANAETFAVSNTLSVAGNTTIGGNLTVDGDLTVTGQVSFNTECNTSIFFASGGETKVAVGYTNTNLIVVSLNGIELTPTYDFTSSDNINIGNLEPLDTGDVLVIKEFKGTVNNIRVL